jgi:hypothetical protein
VHRDLYVQAEIPTHNHAIPDTRYAAGSVVWSNSGSVRTIRAQIIDTLSVITCNCRGYMVVDGQMSYTLLALNDEIAACATERSRPSSSDPPVPYQPLQLFTDEPAAITHSQLVPYYKQ